MLRRIPSIAAATLLIAIALVPAPIPAPPPPPTWKPILSMPVSRGYFGVAELGGKVYVAGGLRIAIGFTALSEVDVFDLAAKRWSRATDLPTPRWAHVLVASQGRLYVAGGTTSTDGPAGMTTSVVAYDPATALWSLSASMPEARMWPAGFALAGSVHVWGGSPDGTNDSTDSRFAYSPDSNTWTTLSPMPIPRVAFGAAVIGDSVFLTGGWRNLPDVTRFDGTTGTWSGMPEMRYPRGGHGSAAAKGEVFVVGGVTANTSEFDPGATRVESYVPGSNLWASWEAYPQGVRSPGVVGVDATLYAMGGLNANGSSASAFEFAFIGGGPPPGLGPEWILLAALGAAVVAPLVLLPIWRRRRKSLPRP